MKSPIIAFIGVACLGAGLALILSAAAMAFQNGIIADATGGVGTTSPVEHGMWLIGLALTVAGAIMLPLGARHHKMVG